MKHFLFLLIFCTTQLLHAQNHLQLSQFQWNAELLHPSMMSSEAELSMSLFYRNQWLSYPGAPVTQGIQGSYQCTENHVAGLSFISDRIGIYRQNNLHLRYAFRMPLRNSSFFAIAMNAGLKNYQANYAEVNTTIQNDLSFAQNINQWAPNAGFSIAYVHPSFSAAISVNELFNNTTNMNMQWSPKHLHFYSFLNYTNRDNEQMEWQIGMSSKMVKNAPIHVQSHIQLLMLQKIIAGIGFASDKSLSLQAGCYIGSTVRLAYSYDMYFGSLSGQQKGSHEVYIGAGFPFYKNAFSKRKYLRRNGDWKKF